MGKLGALFGRRSTSSKVKPLLNLSISRLAVLKNQRQARSSLAGSDVVQLLTLGEQNRALIRVEHVIKEQNMLDAFVMIEGYCNLLAERTSLIQQEKVCPEELKEAVASLIYASSRCGDFPEIKDLRAIFASRFGKEFEARALELRNNCGVSPKMIQKLSTRPPSAEIRLKVLREIASVHNIVLHVEEEPSPGATEEFPGESDSMHNVNGGIESMLGLSDSMKARRKYKDATDAAEEAFKSAAYAAVAARAAVELSRSESRRGGPDGENSPGAKKNSDSEFEKLRPMGSIDSDDSDIGTIQDEYLAEDERTPLYQKRFLLRSGYELKADGGPAIPKAESFTSPEKRPVSVRTRR
ncbi:hypothetical protein NMG60_11036044 [Bertholletia excelsa]